MILLPSFPHCMNDFDFILSKLFRIGDRIAVDGSNDGGGGNRGGCGDSSHITRIGATAEQ